MAVQTAPQADVPDRATGALFSRKRLDRRHPLADTMADEPLRYLKDVIMRGLLSVIVLVSALAPAAVSAEGNLAKRADRLEPLMLDAADGFSIKRYEIETGRFYRWRITSDGREEYMLRAPELIRNFVLTKRQEMHYLDRSGRHRGQGSQTARRHPCAGIRRRGVHRLVLSGDPAWQLRLFRRGSARSGFRGRIHRQVASRAGAPQGKRQRPSGSSLPRVSSVLLRCKKPSKGARPITALWLCSRIGCRSWLFQLRKDDGLPL